jgi:putative phosphotransacetylase
MKKIMVETSARHVHVCERDLETLFGKGYKLNAKKNLSQPGQYASDARVTLVGSKRQIEGVSILGPCRGATQVELSLTDARGIGVEAPVRESGDIAGSGAIRVVGPAGALELKEGCISAKRHLHLDPVTAEKFGIENGQIIKVACGGAGRRVIFDDVVTRVSESYAAAKHIDTDEANAAGNPADGEILG